MIANYCYKSSKTCACGRHGYKGVGPLPSPRCGIGHPLGCRVEKEGRQKYCLPVYALGGRRR